jgi:hypothetical protein
MGIEPTAQAWEAWVLPLYDARNSGDLKRVPRHGQIGEQAGEQLRAELAKVLPEAPQNLGRHQVSELLRRRVISPSPQSPLSSSSPDAGRETGFTATLKVTNAL